MYAGIKSHPTDRRGGTMWFDDDDCSTCAIGAGMVAIKGMSHHNEVLEAFSYLSDANAICPECQLTATLFTITEHLYETHNWSRTATANWLYEREEELGFVTITEEIKQENSEPCTVPLSIFTPVGGHRE